MIPKTNQAIIIIKIIIIPNLGQTFRPNNNQQKKKKKACKMVD